VLADVAVIAVSDCPVSRRAVPGRPVGQPAHRRGCHPGRRSRERADQAPGAVVGHEIVDSD
jgi:hypothetical protein